MTLDTKLNPELAGKAYDEDRIDYLQQQVAARDETIQKLHDEIAWLNTVSADVWRTCHRELDAAGVPNATLDSREDHSFTSKRIQYLRERLPKP